MEISPFRFFGLVGLVAGAIAFVPRARADDTIQSVEKAAAEWARIRGETVRLETDWAWQRETLEASVAALKDRVVQLEQNRDRLKAALASDAAKSGDLSAKNTSAREAMRTIEQRVEQIAASLAATRSWLPPRLSRALELPYRSLGDTALGPAERMQHAMTIFTRCSQFNKSVTFGEEAVELKGAASPRLLEVIYWGMSHAYALDRSGKTAYLGHPGKDGWLWEAQPEIAGDVTRLIAIFQGKDEPAFVQVPVQVSDPVPATPAK